MEFTEIKGTAADRVVAYHNLKRGWKRLETARERNEVSRLAALRAASEKGLSLRHIAQATGLSHQRVHQLLAPKDD